MEDSGNKLGAASGSSGRSLRIANLST